MKNKFKVSTSVTDFSPLLLNLDHLFKGLSETGVDGIELVVGLKSRWSASYIKSLSQKYHLPITSLHQPVWSGLGIFFDEEFVKVARKLGTDRVVFHPLPRLSFESPGMRNYLEKIVKLQKKYGIEVLLENLPAKYNIKFINHLFPPNQNASQLSSLLRVAEEYDLKINYDTSHAMLTNPQQESWFDKALPKISNIHLSSFTNHKQHLPLSMGDFKTKQFITHLYKKKYTGAITFEIYYPSLVTLLDYDFSAIKDSVEIVKKSI